MIPDSWHNLAHFNIKKTKVLKSIVKLLAASFVKCYDNIPKQASIFRQMIMKKIFIPCLRKHFFVIKKQKDVKYTKRL